MFLPDLTPGLVSSTLGWDKSPKAYSAPGDVDPAGERTIIPGILRDGFLIAWRAKETKAENYILVQAIQIKNSQHKMWWSSIFPLPNQSNG